MWVVGVLMPLDPEEGDDGGWKGGVYGVDLFEYVPVGFQCEVGVYVLVLSAFF